ncbi:MAG TPA: ribosome small subunit-dependent GTPase A [Gemmataceae bacterium]|jgi:ribosome biogenesis GTPase|nr:ribosome small subunit-dependent GTPase A [Gemmataceae bacterium]
MGKKKKTRVDLRKNRSKPPRPQGWTRDFQDHGFLEEGTQGQERVRAKGDLSRKRTIMQSDVPSDEAGAGEVAMPAVDKEACLTGRVLRVHGLASVVETADGRHFRCAVRRVLRNLVTEERNIVATGDHVWFRPSAVDEGVIERVEPRHGLLTRASRGREHVLVANVDQVVIVMAIAEPALKPHLIDRYLVSAEQGGIQPLLCLNKIDLADPVALQPLIGSYSQLGVPVFLTSVPTGQGIDELRRRLPGRQTVFAGQSGVGKSSLLNAIQPGLGLSVAEVSENNNKGKHTTTTAQLIKLEIGGWVVDTPGIRQFQLWDVMAEELEGFFPEFRPLVAHCSYADCTHTHEGGCAIRRAVALGQISERRYISYRGMCDGAGEN